MPNVSLVTFILGGLLLAGIAAAPGAAETTPLGKGDNPAVTQADAWFDNYRFGSGGPPVRVRIHYATLGAPRRGSDGQINNAVLLLHWTGSDGRALLTPAWMKALFYPGRPLDFGRYYLIFPDSIGEGRSSKPSDGSRMHFPKYGYPDMVDLQHKLVTETLGIRHLHAIVGMSMGGMNAWQWAETWPDAMDGVMPVVSLPIKISGRNLIWRRLSVGYIESDPGWQAGNYSKPFAGLVRSYQLLRMMIDGVPHMQALATDTAAADKFNAEAAVQATGLDANDFLYSLKSSADYDPEPELGRIRTKVFALNFDDDEFNPDRLRILERLMSRVRNGRYAVQAGSKASFGHLTMAHPELWSQRVAEFLRWLGDRS